MAAKKYLVKTPNDAFSGVRNGLPFVNGIAVCGITKAKELKRVWGYKYSEIKDEKTGANPE